MIPQVRPSGPPTAKIMIVGEAPGEHEVAAGQPFVGASGQELNRMLHEAGIARSECFVTNVVRVRPPDNDLSHFMPAKKADITPDCVLVSGRHVKPVVVEGIELLNREIELVKPRVIIALGNFALWALTGNWGITSWRGSTLPHNSGAIVVPSIHPASILRDWSQRQVVVHDFKRALKCVTTPPVVPEWRFILRPDFHTTLKTLKHLSYLLAIGPTKLSVDIETRQGHIACLGIAWTKLDAICIPLMCTERKEGYWSIEEEVGVIMALHEILTHPNARVIGQNFIYDAQYIWRHYRFVPHFYRDTMLAQHSMFSAMPKGLDFLSSLYCEYHVYWKDDGKEWHTEGEETLWKYNCEDCVRTYEIDDAQQPLVDTLGLRDVHDFQQRMWWRVLRTMCRGLRVDNSRRSQFAMTLSTEMATREQFFIDILGHPLNPRSSKKMKELFYDDLKQPIVWNRKVRPPRPTCDDDALSVIAKREPILRPLCRAIQEYRSLGVFLSTFVNAQPAWDGRMRSSFNIGGTETYRLSSSQDAFGSGMNLQNIPSGTDSDDPDELHLPNVRMLFTPDPGHEFFDIDLDRADLQVVVWEAEDEELKSALREGVDLHSLNAKTLFNLSCPLGDVKKFHPDRRALAKAWVHGTNYGGSPRTMAATCGISVHQAEQLRARWFQAHPGIKRWHKRTKVQLKTHRFVENKFGNRRYYFERLDGVLPEALAWVPQSTVACVINRAWDAIETAAPWIEVLLQVHDSLAGQYPIARRAEAQEAILRHARVVIPYPEPLTIPVGIKTSTKSWGECEQVSA